LSILNISGEKIYEIKSLGQVGLNSLDWTVQNNAGASVASGLYIYVAREEDGISPKIKIGKILVLR